MRIFITGSKKCGKSLLAEKMLLTSTSGKELGYIGTLPNNCNNITRIMAHQTRRDARWNTYEITEDWKHDNIQLKKFFNEDRPILLDGLSILIWRVLKCSTSPDWYYESQEFIESFIEMLNESICDWIVVDVDQPYPYSEETKQFIEIANFTHEKIISVCGATKKSIK